MRGPYTGAGAGQGLQSQAGLWPTGSGSSDQLSKMPGVNSPGEDCGAGSLLLEWGKREIGVRQ